tara:strand:+ start:2823 stop:3068 length:246 start_codon:yes stop_codon:yes gene_type:complete
MTYKILKAYANQDTITTVTEFNIGDKIEPVIVEQNHFPVSSINDVLQGIINMANILQTKYQAIPTVTDIVNNLELDKEVTI